MHGVFSAKQPDHIADFIPCRVETDPALTMVSIMTPIQVSDELRVTNAIEQNFIVHEDGHIGRCFSNEQRIVVICDCGSHRRCFDFGLN